jgi:hypothetical protein
VHPQLQLTTMVLALVLLGVTLELVRRNKLLEDYSVLWLLMGAAMLAMALWRGAVPLLARLTGVIYAPSAVFIAVLSLCFALLMHFAVVISRLTRQVTALTQRLAIMEMEAAQCQKVADEPEGGPSA